MRKLIGAINMTIDGICDHTAGIPDEEIHRHYADLLDQSGAILYGRVTYQLMQFWQTLLQNPSGEKSMDEFALAIDRIPKIVFSHMLSDTGWASAELSDKSLKEKALELKEQAGKDLLVGSRSLIMQLMQLNLLDEFQLCIHPVVAGQGSPLFDRTIDRRVFRLAKTRTFRSGAVLLCYEREMGL